MFPKAGQWPRQNLAPEARRAQWAASRIGRAECRLPVGCGPFFLEGTKNKGVMGALCILKELGRLG